jgi:serine/threonine-protein kinase
MRLRLFGTAGLQGDAGSDIPADPQPKRLALLAYLAVAAPGDLVRRDSLLAMFWPEATEQDARRALNQAVHYLRQLVGAEVIRGGAETLGVDLRLLPCDVTEFDQAIVDGRLETALELYRGPLMKGFFISGAGEFDDWLARERETCAHAAPRTLPGRWPNAPPFRQMRSSLPRGRTHSPLTKAARAA